MSPRHLKAANWVLLSVLVLLGWLWQGRDFALGVLVGGLLAVVNFHVLAYILNRTLNRSLGQTAKWERGTKQAIFFAKYILRVTVLAAILYFLIRYNLVNVFGLIIGLSTVVITLILAGINEIRKIYHKEVLVGNGTSNPVS